MTDAQETDHSEESGLINIYEPKELRDWAIYFSVSREKITEAVISVGPMVEDVKLYLKK